METNIRQLARVCSQSSQPNETTREMNKRQERLGEFVVARGDASEMLEPCKEALDQIASAIEMPIELARCQAIGSGWNHRFCARRFDGGHEMVGIVALVGHHGLTGQIFDQCWGKVDIGNLPGREDDAQGIAQCVDGNVQFGRQSAARAADFLTTRFFWAPAECWWARTMVESMNSCSISASPPSTSATRSQTPLSRQRAKRTYVLCQLPQFVRQVLPWAAGAQNPENRFDKDTVVPCRAAGIAGLAWQDVFNTRPLVISKHLPVHPDSTQKSGYDHNSPAVNSPLLCH